MERHRHNLAYAAVVLSGRYFEAGDTGRWAVEPGYVIVHGAHEAHWDLVSAGGAVVLNFPLPLDVSFSPVLRVSAVDEMIRAARTDPAQAAPFLNDAEVVASKVSDWSDILAADIRNDPGLRIAPGPQEWHLQMQPSAEVSPKHLELRRPGTAPRREPAQLGERSSLGRNRLSTSRLIAVFPIKLISHARCAR
jgi:hypothetical protein